MTSYQKIYFQTLVFYLYLLTFLGLCVNAIFDYRFLARFIPLAMIVVFMVGMVVSVVRDGRKEMMASLGKPKDNIKYEN
jgi:hypothetical protein